MNAPALYYVWNGSAMEPMARFSRLAEQSFTSGHAYRMIVDEERSAASHRQFFAAVREAFLNLPEDLEHNFASPEHLRKWALIKAGFRDERSIAASSKAEAQRIAAFIRPMDEFAIVVVRDAIVTQYTAKSQSLRAMGRAEFQRSKDAVFDVLAKLVGTNTDDLKSARAA